MPTPNSTVVVPDGDVDEREELDKTDEYDSKGGCQCKCALTSSTARSMELSTIIVALCSVMVQVLAI